MAHPAPSSHHVLGTSGAEVPPGMDVVIFAAGCFWGVEKGFWRLPGVHHTATGYAGGYASSAVTYEAVCSGTTGHAEAVRVVFDPRVLGLADLLRWFWQCHVSRQCLE